MEDMPCLQKTKVPYRVTMQRSASASSGQGIMACRQNQAGTCDACSGGVRGRDGDADEGCLSGEADCGGRNVGLGLEQAPHPPRTRRAVHARHIQQHYVLKHSAHLLSMVACYWACLHATARACKSTRGLPGLPTWRISRH